MSPINPLLVGLLRSFRNFTCRVRWLLFVAIRAMHAFLITSSTCELHFLYIESDISSHESVHNQPINSKRITLNTINPLPRKEKRRRRRLIARTLSLYRFTNSEKTRGGRNFRGIKKESWPCVSSNELSFLLRAEVDEQKCLAGVTKRDRSTKKGTSFGKGLDVTSTFARGAGQGEYVVYVFGARARLCDDHDDHDSQTAAACTYGIASCVDGAWARHVATYGPTRTFSHILNPSIF